MRRTEELDIGPASSFYVFRTPPQEPFASFSMESQTPSQILRRVRPSQHKLSGLFHLYPPSITLRARMVSTTPYARLATADTILHRANGNGRITCGVLECLTTAHVAGCTQGKPGSESSICSPASARTPFDTSSIQLKRCTRERLATHRVSNSDGRRDRRITGMSSFYARRTHSFVQGCRIQSKSWEHNVFHTYLDIASMLTARNVIQQLDFIPDRSEVATTLYFSEAKIEQLLLLYQEKDEDLLFVGQASFMGKKPVFLVPPLDIEIYPTLADIGPVKPSSSVVLPPSHSVHPIHAETAKHRTDTGATQPNQAYGFSHILTPMVSEDL
ncbi:hypothetical protein C8R45DRAFT_1075892 [Mycena sanguinolenta]|nr:hypothetical protein C8R45DRAFT_1075892 [Mycena sanguinolenta]